MTFPRDSEATAPKEAFVMQLAAVEGCKTRQPSTRLYINKMSATHSSAVRISDMCFHSVGDWLTGSSSMFPEQCTDQHILSAHPSIILVTDLLNTSKGRFTLWPSISKHLLFQNPSFCIQDLLILVDFRCILGGSVEEERALNNIL